MKVIADLQLHSRYARATSQKMDIHHIHEWAGYKGIGLIATGDWTHPLWIREIKANLEEIGNGLLKLNSQEPTGKKEILFLLATEISSIYTQGGKLRRIHNLIWAPSLKTAEKIIKSLESRGCNLKSDGRPIVGLTSQEITELVLTIDESCLIIPAHAWTPWFSLYGSKSGFDSIEECFGKYAKYIYAIETGLSSDPVMNWRIKDLDDRQILSFGDAHSGPKLGREATVFELEEINYHNLRQAIIGKSAVNKVACTFEFYPEEGKYHYTGHRSCNLRQTPAETLKQGTICPVCGRGLTVGVMHRVEELAGRELSAVQKKDENGVVWNFHPQKTRPPFVNLVPLMEIIGEVVKTNTYSQKVINEYNLLIKEFGSEFTVLLKTPLDKIREVAGADTAAAIAKVREADIFIDPGYDGVFGTVKIWANDEDRLVKEKKDSKEQMNLF